MNVYLLIPGLSLRSNPGLKLANAFGVWRFAFCLTYQKSGYINLSLTCRTCARMNSDTSCALDERMGTSQTQ